MKTMRYLLFLLVLALVALMLCRQPLDCRSPYERGYQAGLSGQVWPGPNDDPESNPEYAGYSDGIQAFHREVVCYDRSLPALWGR